MAQHKSLGVLSRYEQIALDIASRILRDEYKVGGQNIWAVDSGRSVQGFAGDYTPGCGPAPRCRGVVETAPGMGG